MVHKRTYNWPVTEHRNSIYIYTYIHVEVKSSSIPRIVKCTVDIPDMEHMGSSLCSLRASDFCSAPFGADSQEQGGGGGSHSQRGRQRIGGFEAGEFGETN